MDKLKRYSAQNTGYIFSTREFCASEDVAALESRVAELQDILNDNGLVKHYIARSDYHKDRADRLAVMCDALASEQE